MWPGNHPSDIGLVDTVKTLPAMEALGRTVAGEEILKNSFANFAFENFEIAAHR